MDLHCLQEKPADQDPYCLQESIYIWFHTVFESINYISTKVLAYLFFQTSKIFNGQVHFSFLLVPGQVENVTISTPLAKRCLYEVKGSFIFHNIINSLHFHENFQLYKESIGI